MVRASTAGLISFYSEILPRLVVDFRFQIYFETREGDPIFWRRVNYKLAYRRLQYC